MQYALLINERPGMYDLLDDEVRESVFAEFVELLTEPEVRSGQRLHGPDTATTVRVTDGEATLTDGPFAETREILAGFYLVDVQDLDAALRIARRLPVVRFGGSVEVRPVLGP